MSTSSLYFDDLRPIRRRAWGRLFGSSIQATRIACDLSVEQAASLAGMEPSQWLAIEAGWVPDPVQLHPMSDALGLRYEKIALLAFMCQGAWEQ